MYEIKQIFESNGRKMVHDINLGRFESLTAAQNALHKYVTGLINDQHLENDVLVEEAMQTVIYGDDIMRAGKQVYQIMKVGETSGQE